MKIDEQSIIQEVDGDETPVKDPKNAFKQQKENTKQFKNDSLAVRVVYFLKDFTQVK